MRTRQKTRMNSGFPVWCLYMFVTYSLLIYLGRKNNPIIDIISLTVFPRYIFRGYNMPYDVFIGLSLDTTVSYPPYSYIYTNGVAPTYLPWGSIGEPDNQATDFCIRLARKSSLGFHTISCGSSYDYLCSSGMYKLLPVLFQV